MMIPGPSGPGADQTARALLTAWAQAEEDQGGLYQQVLAEELTLREAGTNQAVADLVHALVITASALAATTADASGHDRSRILELLAIAAEAHPPTGGVGGGSATG